MNLVKIRDSHFINADKIISLSRDALSNRWHILTDEGKTYIVDPLHEHMFLNHINGINENIVTVK